MKIATVTSIGNLNTFHYDEVLHKELFVGTHFEEDEVQTIGIPSKDVMLISPFDAWSMDFKWVDDPTKKWWQFWKDSVLQKNKKKHFTGTVIEVKDGKKRIAYCVKEPYEKVKEMLED